MTLARRVATLEAIRESVSMPDRKDPYAMWGFAMALIAAERLEGERRLASLIWEWRGRLDMAAATDKGDVDALEASFTSLTDAERNGILGAAKLLLEYLDARDK